MKTCLLCDAKAPDDAVTCPNDGEASWSVLKAPAAPKHAPAPVPVYDEPAEEPVDDSPKRAARKVSR